VEQDALITVHQLPLMVLGDFLGAMLGALLFNWGARKLKLDQLARNRAQALDD
jgi:glycerol uptake facilitator-like aquaporin